MIPLSLEKVAEATSGEVSPDDGGIVVEDVTTDSREVRPDSLFVALRGESHDGHDHVRDALQKGARGYLAERRVDDLPGAVVVADTWRAVADLAAFVRALVDPLVVAITGSVGKTTAKDLTAAAIGSRRRTVAAPASFNNEVGVPLTCLAVTAETEVLVTEVGSRGVGHIASLIPVVRPDISIVTAVAGAHLEMFGDLDTIARAKRELVEGLPPDGTAILNADDARVAAMARHTPAAVVTYGIAGAAGVGRADVVAEDVALDRLARPHFRVRTPWGDTETSLPLAGRHQVGNALAAIAAAGVAGVEITAAAAALQQTQLSGWRSEVAEVDGIVILNDAYNANPSSTRAALETLVEIEREGRTWAVLGVMAELGDGSPEAHTEIGRVCASLGVDRLVVVGQEARGILEGARMEGALMVDDADGALEAIVDDVRPGDVVLVKASRVAGLERVASGLEAARSGGSP